MTFELPPGVCLLERGWLSSNNVLLMGRHGTALVDSGYTSHSEQTLGLVDLALSGQPLDLLLNTHLHSDHCGGNAALQARYPEVKTLIPPGESDAVRQWDEAKLSYLATGQACPRFAFDDLLQPDTWLEMGDAAWQIHAAPGHDPHAIILFEPISRLLISGDALWQRGFGVVFPEMWGEPSFDQVGATLDLIESLRPACVIPGHGTAFDEVDTALSTARERLNAFIQSPEKHARHAVKVLIKFKLLDARCLSRVDFDRWIANVTYLEQVRRRFAPDVSIETWGAELLKELVKTGAAREQGDLVLDSL
ncbi:MAG: MBL fold metallo-hydrolase [Proteobacteria bacterium]|nr:MBL fold metallo-hydrolase [Pseudomonadota bacterium]